MLTETEVKQKLLTELDRRIEDSSTSVEDLKLIAEAINTLISSENMRSTIQALTDGLTNNNTPKN